MASMKVCVVALLVGYVASYIALLQPMGVFSGSGAVHYRFTRYRTWNDQMRVLFQPINWVDQRVRPGYWGEPIPIAY